MTKILHILWLVTALLIVACSSRTFDFDRFVEHVSATSERLMTETITEPGLFVFDSDDGNVRVYGYEYPFVGTIGEYGTLILYRWGNQIKLEKHLPTDAELWGMPTAVYTLGDGKYIICQYARRSSIAATITATVYELSENGLVELTSLTTEDNTSSRVFWPGEAEAWNYTDYDREGTIFSFKEDTNSGKIRKYHWSEKVLTRRL